MTQQHEFQADVGRLLDIVANALYSEREIFLRELISNAGDACDRLRYEAIARPELTAGDGGFKISITVDTGARMLTISDNGIGMTADEMAKNLGTIAHSGTRAALNALNGDKKNVNLIGQFGVGFYSSFMVAIRVTVTSRKAGSGEAHIWASDGRSGYTLAGAKKETHGTDIVLHLKEDAGEFLLEERLRQVIKKYSDYIGFPVLLNGAAANSGVALWMRPKADVTEDQYAEFYAQVSGGYGFDKPWMTLHAHAEGAMEYRHLLFVPGMKPFDLYDPRRAHGVKLYVKRVFIAEGLEGLIPPFLRFLRGVVDSEDLPLNISREMLQASPVLAKISTAVTRKVLSALIERAEKEPDGFAEFWALFGPVVKEGLYDAHAYRDLLCRLVRFRSTLSDKLVSLEDYAGRMREGQEHIYYLSTADVEAAKNSPQLEAFKVRGIEVLYMTDAIDEFWLPMQGDYKGKKFQSVTRGAMPEAAQPPKEEGADALVSRLKEILQGEVKDVRLSQRLVESPVCLVAAEGEADIHMQRLLKKSQGYEARHNHVLEVNAGHPVIRRLREMAANDADADSLRDAAFLLLDQARIIEGEPLSDTGAFIRRMTAAIEKGLLGG